MLIDEHIEDGGSTTNESTESSQLLSMFSPGPLGPQASLPASDTLIGSTSQGPEVLTVKNSTEKSQLLSMFWSGPLGSRASPPSDALPGPLFHDGGPVPTRDARLGTMDSSPGGRP